MKTQQLAVEGEIFVALGVLHPRGDRHLRRVNGARAENGKILEHEPDMGIGAEQRDRIGQSAFAIAATVIEKLHQCDVAIGIADEPPDAANETDLARSPPIFPARSAAS